MRKAKTPDNLTRSALTLSALIVSAAVANGCGSSVSSGEGGAGASGAIADGGASISGNAGASGGHGGLSAHGGASAAGGTANDAGQGGADDAGQAGDSAENTAAGASGHGGGAAGAAMAGHGGTAGGAAGHGGTAGGAGRAEGGGTAGGALRLDGVDDYVELPAASGAANEAAFTSELWFKTTAPTGMLLEVYSASPTGADRSLYLELGKVCFYVFAPSYSELCSGAAGFADGGWHHAAGTLGSAGQVLYVDGVVVASEASITASAFNFDTGFRAGYGYIGPNGPLTFFAGRLDEIRIWNVQRSAAEIVANLGRTIDPATSGLQGYWMLDSAGQTPTAVDSTAGGHDGTLLNFAYVLSPWVTPGAF